MIKNLDSDTILRVENLVTTFDTEAGRIRAVDDIGFVVKEKRTLGIVGESGCGKSVTALSIMRLLPKPTGRIEGGRILFKGLDIIGLPAGRMHEIRGNRIAMIFQEPMTALNPVHRIGQQIAEVYRLHSKEMDETEIRGAALAMLNKVDIPDPDERMTDYPHQISGGMRQRVMIAMALATRPDILIADEPTTALDVTIQAQVLELIKNLQQETGMAVVFITHDLGVIAEICDDVVVMYAGMLAESAPVAGLYENAAHPYTMGLLASIPRIDSPRKRKLNVIRGMVPSLLNIPDGCRFQNRCPYAMPVCEIEKPPIREVADSHHVACWLYR